MIKNITIQARIPSDIRDAFYEKAKSFTSGSEVLRELVIAFVEDRVTIVPSAVKAKLYNLEK
jgi:hypothetical protein